MILLHHRDPLGCEMLLAPPPPPPTSSSSSTFTLLLLAGRRDNGGWRISPSRVGNLMVNRHDATDLGLSWARTSRSIVFGVEKNPRRGCRWRQWWWRRRHWRPHWARLESQAGRGIGRDKDNGRANRNQRAIIIFALIAPHRPVFVLHRPVFVSHIGIERALSAARPPAAYAGLVRGEATRLESRALIITSNSRMQTTPVVASPAHRRPRQAQCWSFD